MKKLILLICVCCLLISCQNKNSKNNSSSIESNEENHNEPVLYKLKQYDEKGYYETMIDANNIANLYYIDAATKKLLYLCSRLECLHNNDTCTSFISTDVNTSEPLVITSDKKLYLIQKVPLKQKADILSLWIKTG